MRQAPDPPAESFVDSLRQILRIASGYWPAISLAGLFVFGSTLVQLTMPLGVQFLFDEMLSRGDRRALGIAALVLLGLFLLRSVFTLFGHYYLYVTGDRIVTRLRERLHKHLLDLDLRFHSMNRVGELSSRLSSDTATIREAVTDTLVTGSMQGLQLIGATAIMMALNWRLGLIVLMIGPLATIVSRLFNPFFQRFARQLQDHFAKASGVAQEALSSIYVVKAFARTRFESARYAKRIRRVLDIAVKGARIEALYNALLGLIASSSTIAIFWFGGLEVIDGRLTAGALVAFMLYSQYVSESIGALVQEYSGLHRAVGASRHVFQLLDVPTEASRDRGESDVEPGPAAVAFRDLHFAYQEAAPVLRGIDLEIAAGEFVAFVGPSGGGKSTLLALLSRFYETDHGRIEINGRNVSNYRLESLRQSVSIVSQEVVLFDMSIRDNIRYGRLEGSDEEVEAAARAAHADDFIRELPDGYDTRVGERGVMLSGGQRQRVSIARAILKKAPILILDEATSSVDAASESVIQDALRQLQKDRTTLAIAHRLSTVRAADRIVVLQEGVVAEVGSHSELLARGGIYAELVRTQFADVAADEEDVSDEEDASGGEVGHRLTAQRREDAA